MYSEWTITDPDCNQKYMKLEDGAFLFKEDRLVDPITGDTVEFELEISLDLYSDKDKIEAMLHFGYDRTEIESWIANNENLPLIAECLFELEN
jgi:hypothetical protein